jgi:hypothetical protein
MREFELTIDSALAKGLNPAKASPVNSPFLSKALGFRCGIAGLEAFPLATNPISWEYDIQYQWPFPQYVKGEKLNFLIVRDIVNLADQVYLISEDNSTLTFVFTVDQLTFGLGATLMEVADFGEYVFMTDGVCMIFWNVLGAWNSFTSSAMIPRIGTVCNFKGRLVGGNVKTAWYDCDTGFYIWGRIGKADFTPTIDNEGGYRQDPYGGIVYHTRRLEDFVVGYSSKGICALVPAEQHFGCSELLDIGLVNMGAMNGTIHKQLFVGEDLIIREISKEGIKELGYYNQMKNLKDDGEDIIVTYDRANKDFFIGNSTKTYLLSKYGMTDMLQHPSAVWRTLNDRVHMLPADIDDEDPTISSDIIDMGFKGMKTTSIVETDATEVTLPQSSVDYANDQSNWNVGSFTPINNSGVASVVTSGDLFKVNVKFSSMTESMRIGYMKLRYKMTDLRSIRGVYAPPTSLRGQSD